MPPPASSDPPCPDLPGDDARLEQRRYLFDMLEQLAAMAVTCEEKEVADVLYALVAVYGDETDAAAADGRYSAASN